MSLENKTGEFNAVITGTGSYLPEKILTNAELAKTVDTSDEWIQQMVGIKSRHIASVNETTSYMATMAGKEALKSADMDFAQIDLVLVATSTADDKMPSTAVKVQGALGPSKCMAFDINAACSGFIYGLEVAWNFIKTGSYKNILLIGAESMSKVVDWSDRSTCVLFGDGAGAVILSACSEEPKDNSKSGIIASKMFTDGSYRDLLYIPGHSHSENFLAMEGNKVFKHAVTYLQEAVTEVLAGIDGISESDIDWLIPHQANLRIIAAAAKKLNLSMDKVVLTLQEHGNTSAASVPLALDVAVKSGKVKKGELLLLEAFGSGFVWGAVLVRF
jgi:3-oxoacyl-[acyl-carrier-protein] synthase III